MHYSAYNVVLADTKCSRNIHYGLRYQVYCLEKGFEDPSRFKDGMERDMYDARATHFILRSQAEDEWVGTCRVIMGPPASLPAFKVANHSDIPCAGNNSVVAECSRLAIPREFQKNSRVAAALLIYAGFHYARDQGARQIYFLSSRSMGRLLDSIGIVAYRIGSEISYRGTRYLFVVDLDNMYKSGISPYISSRFQKNNLYSRFSSWLEIGAMVA